MTLSEDTATAPAPAAPPAGEHANGLAVTRTGACDQHAVHTVAYMRRDVVAARR